MKFIVAGVGFWGRKWIELLQTFPRASVVAAVDKSEAAAEWSQETYGIPCFPDLASAAQKVSADAVLVVTNPNQHKPVVLEALRLQKYGLVQKTMGTTIGEALQHSP